jgi:hypothetical protein
VVALALAVVGWSSTPVAVASPPTVTLSGQGSDGFSPDSQTHTVIVNATSTNGVTTGTLFTQGRTGNAAVFNHFEGNVTCMVVDGNRVVVGALGVATEEIFGSIVQKPGKYAQVLTVEFGSFPEAGKIYTDSWDAQFGEFAEGTAQATPPNCGDSYSWTSQKLGTYPFALVNVIHLSPAITSPSDGFTSRTGDVTISGTGEPNTMVRLYEVGKEANAEELFVNAGGTWSIKFTGISDGIHFVTASAVNGSTVPANTVEIDVEGVHTPMVVTGAASSITQTSATLNATVNPNGETLSDCHFDYGTTTSYGSSVPCSTLPGGVSVASGTSAVAVSAPVSGLTPGTTYFYRIEATNAGGTGQGVDQALTTLPATLVPVSPGGAAPVLQGTPPVAGLGVLASHESKSVPDAKLSSTSFSVSPSGIVSVNVACPLDESSCAGTVALRTLKAVIANKKPKAAILTLATGSFTVAGGHTTTVKLHLSAKARELLARSAVLRVLATIVAHDPAGATHTTQTVVTLHAPRRHHGDG